VFLITHHSDSWHATRPLSMKPGNPPPSYKTRREGPIPSEQRRSRETKPISRVSNHIQISVSDGIIKLEVRQVTLRIPKTAET
jgi:hypothetical protein